MKRLSFKVGNILENNIFHIQLRCIDLSVLFLKGILTATLTQTNVAGKDTKTGNKVQTNQMTIFRESIKQVYSEFRQMSSWCCALIIHHFREL